MYAITVIGFGLWIAYGLLLKSWPLVGSNVVNLSLSSFILTLKFRYRNGPTSGAARPWPIAGRRGAPASF